MLNPYIYAILLKLKNKWGLTMIFAVMFGAMFIISIFGAWFISGRIRKYNKIKELGKKGIALSVVAPILLFALLCFIPKFGFAVTLIIFMHLLVALSLCVSAGFVIHKFLGKKRCHFAEDITAIYILVIYLGIGWFLAHHVFETSYTFETQKDLGQENLRVVQISDSHLGITLDGEDFAEYLQEIQGLNPDVVVITGDFVDDDSEKEDMLISCKALGELKTTYGVYFVFGNHDEGYFNSRSFSVDELRASLEENGVKILEDESVLINDSFYIIGRNDRSYTNRESMESLVSRLDKSKYMLVLDHQPSDFDAQAEANVDLVLSGHTHGGHIFPAGIIGVLMGSNDLAYGTEVRGNTVFEVSSGISGWAIPFKTGCISEYVVIDIKS